MTPVAKSPYRVPEVAVEQVEQARMIL
jgi:hypothetical protein